MAKPAQNSRQAVLDSAIKVFSRRGFAGASIDEILRETGLSKPTLYYHFESKAGLFAAIMDFAYDRCFELMSEAVQSAPTTRDRLIAAAEALFSFSSSHQNLLRLVFATAFASPDEIPPGCIDSRKRRRNLEFMSGIVESGIKSGDLDGSFNPMELTYGIFGVVSHQIRMNFLDHGEALDRQRAERVVDLFLAGASRKTK